MVERLRGLRDFHGRLWEDFVNRYLFELRKFHANRVPRAIEDARRIKVGDTVLVVPEDGFKRSRHFKLEWPQATVVELAHGQDTRYRRVKVEMHGSKTRLERPIQKLCLLESDDASEKMDTSPIES